MFKQYFFIFLLGHLLGDFYFQTENMARKKEENIKWVVIHCLVYLAAIMFALSPVASNRMLELGSAVAGAHGIVDILKNNIVRRIIKNRKMTILKERNIFFIDQFLHMLCLAFAAYAGVSVLGKVNINKWLIAFTYMVGIPKMKTLSWLIALLLIHKPANIIISKWLKLYKPSEQSEMIKRDSNAGRFIGTLERLLILIFISLEQYSAIGLVLTAKSIARYDRISREKDFAEYYLLGTLLSTAIVMIVSYVI